MTRDREACTPAEPVIDVLHAALDSFAATPLAPFPQPANPGGYQRVTLRCDEQIEVAAARWLAGGQCGWHGHDGSAAVYTVLSGAIEEERCLPDGGGYRYEAEIMKPGQRSYLPPGSFHRVRAIEEALTLHSYSPPPACATTTIPPAVEPLLAAARHRIARTGEQVCRPCPDIVSAVRELLDGWAEREAEAQREGRRRLPSRTLDEMRSSGILAAPIPHHLGGWDASLEQTAAAVRLVAQRAPATALALAMPLGNAATTRIPASCVPPTARVALSEGQHWIAEQVGRGRILAVANSEPGAGGDLANTKTTARRGADGAYRLTGRKSFATFGPDADYFLCAALRVPEWAEGGPVVDGFFVSRHAAGLHVDDRWDPAGMGPTASVGLTLRNTVAEAILGYPGCLQGINARHWSTVLFAAVFLGIGEGALREGLAHAAAAGGWARSTLAEHALRLDAAAGYAETVARDERWPLPAEARERTQRAKTFAARTAVETATHVAMVSGGRCYAPNHPVFRFLCDALAGPLLRPPLPQAMDAIARQLFPPVAEPAA
jgi:alkylation response protein AidB-like acyl-CoA dehydrogenase